MGIQIKRGPCPDCVARNDFSDKPLVSGRCQMHYRIYRTFVRESRRELKQPEAKTNLSLRFWYAEIKNKFSAFPSVPCWECGASIPAQYLHNAVAHVVPKSIFRSVATHPDNYLILGAHCGCHQRYDRSWEDAAKMKIWPEARRRFTLLRSWVKEENRIPPQLSKTKNDEYEDKNKKDRAIA